MACGVLVDFHIKSQINKKKFHFILFNIFMVLLCPIDLKRQSERLDTSSLVSSCNFIFKFCEKFQKCIGKVQVFLNEPCPEFLVLKLHEKQKLQITEKIMHF